MLNLFLDCGTNLGQGLLQFDKMYNMFNNDEWIIYTFEPNPHIHLDTMFNNISNLTKINKAVWVEDTQLEFSCKGKKDEMERMKYNEERFQGGGSQIATTNHQISEPSHVEMRNVTVDAFNFSQFLTDNHDKYKNIVVKFDIEGAEFKIIDKLVEDNTLQYIDYLFMEPHGRFFFQKSEWDNKKESISEIEKELFDKCKPHTNVHLWS